MVMVYNPDTDKFIYFDIKMKTKQILSTDIKTIQRSKIYFILLLISKSSQK